MASNGGRRPRSGSMRTSPSAGSTALITKVSWYPGRMVTSWYDEKGVSSISAYSMSSGGKSWLHELQVSTDVDIIL